MRKKKRSAKQLANDRRLGRMAKARAKAKRGGRRKTVKRKNPCNYGRKKNVHATRRKKVRRTSAGSWYQIFKCKGASVHYLALTTLGKLRWTLTRGDTIRWSSKSEAAKIAKRLARGRKLSGFYVGVAGSHISASAIVTECKGGKV